MTPEQIRYQKLWSFPNPKDSYTKENYNRVSDIKVSQQKFYDEYHVSGHQIFNRNYYKDIQILDDKKNVIETIEVDRVAFSIQFESIDIVLAHLLGNHTQFTDSTVGENKAELMAQYKEFWDTKNMESFRNQFAKSALAVGDVAGLFYYEGNILKWKILSFLDNEQIYIKNDKYGELEYFGRFYFIMEAGALVEYCDIIDKVYSKTFKQNDNAIWTEVSSGAHGFKNIPVVYHFRKGGAFWTPAQNNIDKLEVMMSELSEDNHSKTKSLYHIGTDNPDSVQKDTGGGVDTIVTDKDGKFSLIQGADISTQFEKTYEILMERIMNPLGMVYPKSKSSGDMPTGSMKMMFFPTERVVFQLINEFNEPLDKINSIFKEGMIKEHSELANELVKLNVNASIKMFTPQDDGSVMTMLGQGKAMGILSTQTASENAPYAANDENKRIEEEMAAEAAQLALDTNPQPDKKDGNTN